MEATENDVGVEDEVADILGKHYVVIIFNDNIHEMGEIVQQIIKAIHCSHAQAEKIMLEAHKSGRAPVIIAGKERCEHVASVLDQIQIGTKIEEA